MDHKKDSRDVPDRREFLTDAAHRLRQAEVATGRHRWRRKALIGGIVAMLFALGCGLAWLAVNRR